MNVILAKYYTLASKVIWDCALLLFIVYSHNTFNFGAITVCRTHIPEDTLVLLDILAVGHPEDTAQMGTSD